MSVSDQEKTDRYLRNKMSPEERETFEKTIGADADLKRNVAAHKEAIALVNAMGDKAIKDRIRKAGNKITPSNGNTKGINKLWFLFVFLFAAIALGLFYFMQKEDAPPKPDLIYASNFQVPPLSFGNRGEEDVLSAASIAYSKKDYEKAFQLFEVAAPDTDNSKIALAKGICLMELNQFDKAIPILSRFIEDPLYGEQCRWYLALCLIKKEDILNAKIQLQSLIQSADGFQKEEAKKILKNLR